MVRPGAGGRATSTEGRHAGKPQAGAPVRTQPAGRLIYRLRALPVAGAVLQLGAHPDDEDTGMLVTMSHGLGARAVYWSATRGEGGQNRRGPEHEDALGVVRTWESLQARELDGGEVLYGPFYDYGFSKHGDDALGRWGRDDVVREIVRAIRMVQPLVVISRWNGGETDGHGQHQAIGLIADEAFDAAADPSHFPELTAQGLAPWRALKLYHSVAGDWQPGEASHFGEIVDAYEKAGHLRIDTGELDPVAGLTFQEQAHLAVNRHRSQGMGFVPEPGSYYYYYRLVRSVRGAAGREEGFFDGLDHSLVGLADHPGGGSEYLRERLQPIQSLAERAVETFHPERPADAGRLALEGAEALRELRADLGEAALDADDAAALDVFLARKAGAFEDAAAACLGLRAECVVDRARTTPGRPVSVRAQVWNGGPEPVDVGDVRIEAPAGWEVRTEWSSDSPPMATAPFEAAYRLHPPDDAELSVPYWLRSPRGPYRYHWPESGPLGLPLDPPAVSAVVETRVGGRALTLRAPALHTDSFTGGFRRLPLSVLPPIAVSPRRTRELVPASDEDVVLELVATVRCNEDDGAVGTLTLRTPEGWKVDPGRLDLRFSAGFESKPVRLAVTIPAGTRPGSYELAYDVDAGGRDSGFDLEPVRLAAEGALGPADETNCSAEAFHVRRAAVTVDLIAAQFASSLRVGYVEGMEEETLTSLEHFGLDVSALSDDELEFADLGAYDAILVGPNAYNSREALRENAQRVLDYVGGGGTLIVRYQAYGYDAPGLAPYPFSYNQPHDRVTAPDAPVDILEPDHAVMNMPNRLSSEDFDNWVHDRGLYFFGEWDQPYTPILASADPGEDPRRGGLLVAHYGRGTYVYAAYSFFRQIPAGVPGAVRLFANLVGLAEARLRTRTEILRRLPLMDALSDAELQEVAHAMSERMVRAGEHLTREGERAAALYILLDGTLEVFHEAAPDELLATVEPVDSVGELAALGHMPHHASARAKTDSTVLVWPSADLDSWLGRHPELAARLITRVLVRVMGDR